MNRKRRLQFSGATNEIIYSLWAALTLGAAFDGLAAPAVGPEFSVGAPAYVLAANAQMYPSAAFDGTNFLVVWRDNRDGLHAYGTRVTPEGAVLDPDGIRLDPGFTGDVSMVTVARFDSGYLVFVEDENMNISARRISSAGEVGPTNVLRLSGSLSPQPLASNGTNYLLVWTVNSNDIMGSRLNADGTLLDPAGIPICTDTSTQYDAAVAPLGTNWLVTWTDLRREHNGYGTDGDIFGTLVAPGGTVLVPDGFPICTTNQAQGGSLMASLGDTCLVAWTDARNSLYNDHSALFAARINAQGQVLDPQGFVVDNARQYQALGHVATDGANWVVVGSEATDSDSYHRYTVARTISPQGVVTFWNMLEYTLGQYSDPVVAFGRTNYLACWASCHGSQSWMLDIVGARLSRTGTMLDARPFGVGLSASSQIGPAAASDGTNYLLVWSDNRRGDGWWNIFGTRVTGQGAVFEPGGLPLTRLDSAQTNPAVAWGGGQFLVAWVDTRTTDYRGLQSIYAARVAADGTLRETNGFLIHQGDTYGTKMDVASVGSDFLVIWSGQTDTYNMRLCAARVSGAGTLLDASPLVLYSGSGSAWQPKVSSNGTNYLVTFAASYCGRLLVSPGGAILSSNYPAAGATRLASNGSGFLTTGDGAYGISGSLYDGSGALMTNFNFVSDSYDYDAYPHAIAGNGRDYLVVFNPSWLGYHYPVCLMQVTKTGRLVQTDVVGFTNSPGPNQMVVAGNDRNYLLAYWKVSSTAVPRLYARILNAAPVLLNPRLASGQCTVSLDAAAERIYEIESSPDLQRWTVAGSQSNQVGSLEFTLPATGPNGFYRARRVD